MIKAILKTDNDSFNVELPSIPPAGVILVATDEAGKVRELRVRATSYDCTSKILSVHVRDMITRARRPRSQVAHGGPTLEQLAAQVEETEAMGIDAPGLLADPGLGKTPTDMFHETMDAEARRLKGE